MYIHILRCFTCVNENVFSNEMIYKRDKVLEEKNVICENDNINEITYEVMQRPID
jgi:hypothetical protein